MAYIVPLISLLNYGKVDHAMYFYAVNKSFKQLQQLSFAIYDEDGRQIYSETNSFELAIAGKNVFRIQWVKHYGMR